MSKKFTEDQMSLITSHIKTLTIESVMNGYKDLAANGSDDFKQGYEDARSSLVEFYTDEYNTSAAVYNAKLKTVKVPTIQVPLDMRLRIMVKVLEILIKHHQTIVLKQLPEDSDEYYAGEVEFLNQSLASLVVVHDNKVDEHNAMMTPKNKKH